MKLTLSPKVKHCLVYLTILLVICDASESLHENGNNKASDVLSRNRRQFGNSRPCALQGITCANSSPADGLCDVKSDQCISVNAVRVSFVPLKYDCIYICEPVPTTTTVRVAQNTIFISPNDTTDAPQFNVTGTKNTSHTSPSSTDIPDNSTITSSIRTTTENLIDDPSWCIKAKVQCKNGGNCSMKGNIPDCDCPLQWVGTVCEFPCTLECHNNASCMNINGTGQKCNCLFGYDTGTNCRNLIPKPQPQIQPKYFGFWYIYVIGFFVLLVGLLVGFLVLKRLRGRSLLVTKMFHFFQPYEDDDQKIFDTFISFKSSNRDFSQSKDEQFVARTLRPKLENDLNFKTCVHYRDFLPGETIANNIMWAVENSRRTILILSPLYIESEWARLEYQKAQQEMLKMRHKIIPVILEDISKTTIEDPNLKHILSSVTYIEYPGDSDKKKESKFWEMLELALPKKRSRESNLTTESSTQLRILKPQDSCQSAGTDITDISVSPVATKDILENPFPPKDKTPSIYINLDGETNEKDNMLSENAKNLTRILEEGSISTHL